MPQVQSSSQSSRLRRCYLSLASRKGILQSVQSVYIELWGFVHVSIIRAFAPRFRLEVANEYARWDEEAQWPGGYFTTFVIAVRKRRIFGAVWPLKA